MQVKGKGEHQTKIFSVQVNVTERMINSVRHNYADHKELNYLLDSGASRHCTPHRGHLSDYREYKKGEDYATIANGKHVPVRGTGALKIRVPALLDGSSITKVLTLRNVLHIPDFPMSIMSEGELRRAGYDVDGPALPARKSIRSPQERSVIKTTRRHGLDWLIGYYDVGVRAKTTINSVTVPGDIDEGVDEDFVEPSGAVDVDVGFEDVDESKIGQLTEEVLIDMIRPGGTRVYDSVKEKAREELARRKIYIPKDQVTDELMVLHHKLGHRSWRLTAKIAKQRGIPVSKAARFLCKACMQGKGRAAAQSKKPVDHGSRPFSKIYMDVQGPFPVKSKHDGYKYIYAFVDAVTGTGRIYGMTSLAQVRHRLALYLTWVKTYLPQEDRLQQIDLEYGSSGTPGLIDPEHYRVLRGDSASYFTCDATTAVASKFGATIKLSSPYSQARNGIVERWLGAIGEAGESMRYAAKLPKDYWFWARRHASYTRDYLPRQSWKGARGGEERTPYELRNDGKQGTMAHLKGFGSVAYVRNFRRESKLDPRVRIGIYVGWNSRSASHLVYLPKIPGVRDRASLVSSTNVLTDDQRVPPGMILAGYGDCFNSADPSFEDGGEGEEPMVITNSLRKEEDYWQEMLQRRSLATLLSEQSTTEENRSSNSSKTVRFLDEESGEDSSTDSEGGHSGEDRGA